MPIPVAILDRKPARKVADVPVEVLDYLNRGLIESKNLTEWLAVDPVELLRNALPGSWQDRLPELESRVTQRKKPSTLKITNVIGNGLRELAKNETEFAALAIHLLGHDSDSVRCYYGPMIGGQDIPLAVKLKQLRPLAADDHFGCREVAFFSLKPHVVDREQEAVDLLLPWVSDPDENIHRFAVETMRPIGVWTVHLPSLKENPEIALPLIVPLLSDPARYVQNAVANWLNDAAKSQPAWVHNLTEQWLAKSDSKATAYIVKRGRRSLAK
ncbi:MAG: DNA alkylation repair protein [Bacteroidota bacterium]